MPTFTTPAPIAATLEVGGARVRVTASDRADTVVRVEPVDAANRKHLKVAEKTRVEFAAGRLSVKTITPGDRAGSITVTIELPTGSHLAAYLAFSSVETHGGLGDCELHMASGGAQLDRIGALTANIASGEVTIGLIAGGGEIDGAKFGMHVGETNGPVRLANSGGRVTIGHATDELRLSSAACDFDVERADGDVTVETASGAIRIGRMTGGQARLTNGSGDIEVGVGAGIPASIDAKSERGAVHSFVSSEAATASDGKVTVYARTRHGDIVVQRAD